MPGLSSDDAALTLLGVRKEFPGVVALDGVDFELRPGEVHALVGENGAGKSTLMKIISGAYRMTQGRMLMRGREVRIRNPRHAQDLGISIIYQELNLVPHLTVEENIFLGREPRTRFGLIDARQIRTTSERLLADLRVGISPASRVSALGIAEMQMVEIAKALAFEARVLIMDEPTSALTDRETETLFATIDDIKSRGVSIIYISHRLEEIFRIADRATVMRDGRIVATHDVAHLSTAQLIREMVDREVNDHYPKQPAAIGPVVLKVENLCAGSRVRGVNLELHAGEVVGLAGLMGSGRTELARAIFGADPIDSGRVLIHGADLPPNSPSAAIAAGIGFLTEDRKGEGLVLQFSVRQNVTLPAIRSMSRAGVIDQVAELAAADGAISDLHIKTPSADVQVSNLSGGNQQKVVLSKWLGIRARVLIFDEPTRGIDVGAKIEIYGLMNKLVDEGVAILMISSDLPEVLGMSDRILVMNEGRIAGELARSEATQEKVMALAVDTLAGAA